MEHVLAIAGLAAAVVAWFLLQRATGRPAGGCGGCACGRGACDGSGSAGAGAGPGGDAPPR